MRVNRSNVGIIFVGTYLLITVLTWTHGPDNDLRGLVLMLPIMPWVRIYIDLFTPLGPHGFMGNVLWYSLYLGSVILNSIILYSIGYLLTWVARKARLSGKV